MRNPKWHRDEIILALELYFRTEPGQIHASNPEIIELSYILNKLPIHKERPDQVKFRNPNGVGLKLSNFLAIDPNYNGKGMQSFSQLDEKVFNEFVDNKSDLIRIANHIKETSSDKDLSLQLYRIEDEMDDVEVKEGNVIYKLHKHYERNFKINKMKKDLFFKKFGKLTCEVCDFDFYHKYGELGKGFIECHHRKPLFEIQKETQTKLEDLALVCSNCHRMLHRNLNAMSIQDLRNLIT
ncbi:HNH endonuclease [Gaetbulibacter aestuarii]|uniref:HNH endonuclease n=1 Tax=Gaetbulibacter aestuarii TaxID=1502358 RepID=A0ABW7MUZ6_9FLAO